MATYWTGRVNIWQLGQLAARDIAASTAVYEPDENRLGEWRGRILNPAALMKFVNLGIEFPDGTLARVLICAATKEFMEFVGVGEPPKIISQSSSPAA